MNRDRFNETNISKLDLNRKALQCVATMARYCRNLGRLRSTTARLPRLVPTQTAPPKTTTRYPLCATNTDIVIIAQDTLGY